MATPKVNRPHLKSGRKPNTPEQKEYWDGIRKEYQNKYSREYMRDKPAKRMYCSAKQRARRQNIPFDIEESDIQIPTHCPYLGLELKPFSMLGEPRDSVMSLDKLNPEAGYVKGNIEVISWLANNMKNSASPEQLVMFAKTILDRHG